MKALHAHAAEALDDLPRVGLNEFAGVSSAMAETPIRRREQNRIRGRAGTLAPPPHPALGFGSLIV